MSSISQIGRPVVYLITDFGGDGLDVAETDLQLRQQLPRCVQIVPLAVRAFDTIGAGFALAQLIAGLTGSLVEGEREFLSPRDVLFIVNSAGRKDDSNPRPDNGGEPLIYVQHNSGCQALVVDSGFSLSWICPDVVNSRQCEINGIPTQFRTRDQWPHCAGQLVAGRGDFLGAHYSLEHVPKVPQGAVCFVDNFGNIKTTHRWQDFATHWKATRKENGTVPIRVSFGNGPKRTEMACLTDAMFNAPERKLVFAPGSSHLGDRRNPYMELSVRGGRAAQMFHVSPGDKLHVTTRSGDVLGFPSA